MIEFCKGDMLQANVEALVNAVNCKGVMGRGIALQFKHSYPDNFKQYRAACARGEVQPGKMFVHQTGAPANPQYIINFPTKRHWKDKSHMEDIDSGLVALIDEITSRNITSIAIPALGSGLGGLSWELVRSHMLDKLSGLEGVQVKIYPPIS